MLDNVAPCIRKKLQENPLWLRTGIKVLEWSKQRFSYISVSFKYEIGATQVSAAL